MHCRKPSPSPSSALLTPKLLFDTNSRTLSHIIELIYSSFHILTASITTALLLPLVWRVVLIREVSRGLTQFVNPRVPLSASLLRSLLCRAHLDPPPGRERGNGGSGGRYGGRRGLREGWQPALGPHAGMQEMREQGEGGWRGCRVLQGAQAGHGWQRSIRSVCGHAALCHNMFAAFTEKFVLRQRHRCSGRSTLGNSQADKGSLG